jgi:transcriptional regulator with XRE-family HTH domain
VSTDRRDLAGEVRDFLSTRRARITPAQAGLPAYGGKRRVAGLRREEVALLAGMSVDYYIRLERGNLSGASESVLESLARALQLDEAERGHLYDLARAATPGRPAPAAGRVRPSVQRVLDAMLSVPAFVRNARFDVVASNPLGRALYSPVFDSPLFTQRGPVNTARFCFLDPAAREYWPQWEEVADDSVSYLRHASGRAPHDKALTDLVGELSTRSDAFATRWARHDVKLHRSGLKRLRHPVVGDLALPFEALELPVDPGLVINVYTPEPDSPEQEALAILASWAGTTTQEREQEHH